MTARNLLVIALAAVTALGCTDRNGSMIPPDLSPKERACEQRVIGQQQIGPYKITSYHELRRASFQDIQTPQSAYLNQLRALRIAYEDCVRGRS